MKSLLVCVLMCHVAFGAEGVLPGDGSEGNPFLIEDIVDFAVFADSANASIYWTSGVHTRLACDVDLDPALPGREAYTTAVVAPDTDTFAGFQGTAFGGVFDGAGRRITNLVIDTGGADNDYLGLFGFIDLGGQVKNFGIKDSSVTGGTSSYSLGGLCGESSGTIINCYATGSVSGRGFLGGLCGRNEGGMIDHCYAVGSVTGDDSVGGLCGWNVVGTISQSYAAGSVAGVESAYSVGGLCGQDNAGMISNCYATSSVIGGDRSHYLGGLCGFTSHGTISNCYATGTTAGGVGSEYLGGLCGYSHEGTIGGCFWDIETSEIPTSAGGTGLTTAQMQRMSTFVNAGWDFIDETTNGTEDIWSICEDTSYPRFTWRFTWQALPGSGTEADPYIIKDFPSFLDFADSANAATYWAAGVYTRLDCDLDLDPALACRETYTTAVIAPDADSMTPGSFNGTYFSGVFDGAGHTISNLTIDTAWARKDFLGLFGAIHSDGQILNLRVENSSVRSPEPRYLGILCGWNRGTIVNCRATGSVIGGGSCFYLGGLCGSNSPLQFYPELATIRDCSTDVLTAGGSQSGGVGGLCGMNEMLIIGCHATGPVTGDLSASLGGLCGTNNGTVNNCYATGPVSARNSEYLGGLCGKSNGTISNCYATGAVGGEGSESIGGLCGQNYRATISDCYALGSVDGRSYLGGLCGRNQGDEWGNATISNCYATGSVTGSSFFLGGLCGVSVVATVSNCFWDVETSGMSTSAAGTGLTTAEMQARSTFTDAGWDFTGETANGTEDHWKIHEGIAYPHLAWQVLLAGSGTQADPYVIDDFVCFLDFADLTNAATYWSAGVHTRLACDIDLDRTLAGRRVYRTAVIAPDTGNATPYDGVFDGAGHTIFNLTIDVHQGRSRFLGLFGMIGSDGQVRSLGLERGVVIAGDGSEHLGGLCAQNRGAIINCYATCAVTASNQCRNLGGLCGWNGGTVSNCYATGAVTGKVESQYLGGLCGWNDNGAINDCYATGRVTGEDRSRYLGGLCGDSRGAIADCFWDIQKGGPDNGIGTPRTTVHMQQRSTFANAGWDFVDELINGQEDIWRMCLDGVDYPRLAWQFSWNGDLTCPHGVKLDDLLYMAQRWLNMNHPSLLGAADINGDHIVNMLDLCILGQNWRTD